MSLFENCVIWLNTFLAIAVPLFLWWRNKREALLFWMVFTCFTDIIGNQLWFNFSGFKIAGLVLMPMAIPVLRALPGFLRRGILIYLAWNVVRGGFALPIAKFAVIKQLGTQFSDVSVALVLVRLIRELGLDAMARNLYRAIGLSLFGMALEYFLRFDAFRFFTGGRPGLFLHRLRGFSYEPRAAGYSMAVGLVTSLSINGKKWAIPVFISCAIALGLTGSISSLVLAGLGLSMVALARKPDWRLITAAAFGLAIIGFFGPWGEMFLGKYQAFWGSIPPEMALLEKWIHINETCDSSTLNYLKLHPWSFWVGMGPGAQAVLVKTTLLERDIGVWAEAPAIPLPGFGYLLILSNIGILGLGFYCWIFWIKPLLLIRNRGQWYYFAIALFGMFLIQARNLHTLGLGVAWALMIGVPSAELQSLSESKKRDNF